MGAEVLLCHHLSTGGTDLAF
uniref:Uncharacterized protein n=1 Tax=Anguilla anguilla TaxID=7936 RepID=A0A0E9QJ22_ANGAN